MNISPEQQKQLAHVLMPYAVGLQEALIEANRKLVYYTSGQVALNILKKKEVWMRDASCMNDYLEVDYGLHCLLQAFHSKSGARFQSVLDNLYPGLSTEVGALLDEGVPHFRYRTYITCVSEHLPREDKNGRLSMWRAYGGSSSVAIVMNNKAFVSDSNALKAYTSPVAYWGPEKVAQELEIIAGNIEANEETVRLLGEAGLRDAIFNMCKYAVLCTKHPGFHEELEWRVIYCPTIEKSDRLLKEVTTVDGTPQTVYKIPLQNIPEEGFFGAEISELIDRIIIGPTQFPTTIAEAIEAQLVEAGVSDAGDRIVVSDIPLRQ